MENEVRTRLSLSTSTVPSKCSGCEVMSSHVRNSNETARNLLKAAGIEPLGNKPRQVRVITHRQARDVGVESEYLAFQREQDTLAALQSLCQEGGTAVYDADGSSVECGVPSEQLANLEI